MEDSGKSVEEDEAWFEAEHLARVSQIELGAEALLRAGYETADLAADLARPILDLACLPGWPDAPTSGHGWGAALAGQVGGVWPGRRILIDAPGPGHGRTGFVLQLADGLALRCAGRPEGSPLTPVVVLAEDGREDAGRRLLARWTGHDVRVFRHGRLGATRLHDLREDEVERAFAEAQVALHGPLLAAQAYRRFLDPVARGEGLVGLLEHELGRWAAELAVACEDDAGPVWPVLVIDGLRGWLAVDGGELAPAMTALASAVRRAGWILLASDRNLGAAADPWLDLRLELTREGRGSRVAARVAHDRAGPSGAVVGFRWSPALGRYEPEA